VTDGRIIVYVFIIMPLSSAACWRGEACGVEQPRPAAAARVGVVTRSV